MTRSEAKLFVDNYCSNSICADCKLNIGGWDTKFPNRKCLRISVATDRDLKRALELIGIFEDVVDDPKAIEASTDDNNTAANDPINPKHYTDGKIEVIEFIEDKKLGFCLGNAVKYISRAGKKDPSKEIEDLEKAWWYIERRIKELQEGIV